MNAALAPAPVLEVRRRISADDNAWDQFARAHPQGTFFHLSAWASVIERAFGHRSHYLLAQRGGTIEGVLPLVHQKSLLFGNALMSIPFGVYGGVIAANAEAAHMLIDEACALARDLGVDYLELRNRERSDLDWPSRDLYVTFRKLLAPTEEANLLAIPRKQRADGPQGDRCADCASKWTTEASGCTRAYSESVRNLGTPVFARGYFRELQRAFGADCEVLTTVHQGEAVAECHVLLLPRRGDAFLRRRNGARA